jgi:glycosyltransferase involved in cell wall biosynthesis
MNSKNEKSMTASQNAAGPLVPEIGIVTLVPHEWHGPWSTQHYLMNRLARYFPIAWVDPPRDWRDSLARLARPKVADRSVHADPPETLTVHDPAWLPKLYKPQAVARLFDRLRLAGAAQRLRRRGCDRIVLYLWRPDFAPAMDLMPYDFSCYHIDDEYTFSETEKPIETREERLIRRADQIIIHSPALLEKKGHLNPHTMFVPNGVDYAAYATPRPEPADLRDIPHPRVGYTGMIKKQMDLPLLLALAKRHPGWSFVFVGPRGNVAGQESVVGELERLPNVHFLGGRPIAELPAYVQHFDAGMLCYVVNDYTKFIYPLKMHEYLATGRPVVGSPIRTLQDFTHIIALANGVDEWSRALTAALEPSSLSPENVHARRQVARSFDWGRHAATIARAFCERLGTERAISFDMAETPGVS